MNADTTAYIALIKSCGYRVFMRSLADEYCVYTDGTRIGYAQWGGLQNGVSSVHKQNTSTGTGFAVADEITKDTLRQALHCIRPHWGTGPVEKFRDWEAYHQANDFNRQLFEV